MNEPAYDEIARSCDEFVVKYRRESEPRAIDMRELERSLSEHGKTVEFHVKWLMANYEDELEFVALAKWTDEGLIYVAKANGKEESTKKGN